jgi:aspartokinase-like uncharacterized kinase
MWVVKLGGSLHAAPELAPWLSALAEARGPPRVIVPGGGPFADAVRALQPQLALDDLAAHRMAILAMQQYGLYLQARQPRLALAETAAELLAAHAAVWLPWRLAGRSPDLAASWDTTSDSIACWLAHRLRAEVLLLVKSAHLPWSCRSAAQLVAAGLLDPAFPSTAARFRGRILIAGAARPPPSLAEEWPHEACRFTA